MSFSVGTAGVRTVNIITYIQAANVLVDTEAWDNGNSDSETLSSAFDLAFDEVHGTVNDQSSFMAELVKLGITDKSSTEISVENGNTIETNELGEFILDKNGTVKAIKLDCSAADVEALQDLHKKAVALAFVFENTVNPSDEKIIVFIPNINFIYTEEVTGGGNFIVNLELTKTVANVSEFRKVAKFK